MSHGPTSSFLSCRRSTTAPFLSSSLPLAVGASKLREESAPTRDPPVQIRFLLASSHFNRLQEKGEKKKKGIEAERSNCVCSLERFHSMSIMFINTITIITKNNSISSDKAEPAIGVPCQILPLLLFATCKKIDVSYSLALFSFLLGKHLQSSSTCARIKK